MNAESSAPEATAATAAGRLPPEFEKTEAELIALRRAKAGFSAAQIKKRPLVGVALSGGGIRSATFCLGVFQALAQKQLLGRMDYLSTVSGGGFFGGFFGRMFTREWATRPLTPDEKKSFIVSASGPCSHRVQAARKFIAEISALTDGQKSVNSIRCVEAALKSSATPPLVWLRESGNYIAPGGANDGALAAASFLRNWISLLAVMLITSLTGFILCNLIRGILQDFGWMQTVEKMLLANVGPQLWWTPALAIPFLILVAGLLPLGMAYWLTQKYWVVWVGYLCAFGFALGGFFWLHYTCALIFAVVIGLALLIGLSFFLASRQPDKTTDGRTEKVARKPRGSAWSRNLLTSWLRSALLATGGALIFAVLDGWGQTIYAVISYAGRWQLAWPAISSVLGLTVLAPLVRTLTLSGSGSKGKFKVPLQLLALVVSWLTLTMLMTSMAVVSHGLAWRWGLAAPAAEMFANQPVTDHTLFPNNADETPGGKIYQYWYRDKNSVNLNADRLIHVEPAILEVTPRAAAIGKLDSIGLAWEMTLGLILCVLLGKTIGFLNLSSLHTVYTARIIRAYQGASNPARWQAAATVLETDSEDNIAWAKYQPHLNGGPLHLINSTLNCTESVETGADSTTAKGFNLGVGPAGISYGQHHALFEKNANGEITGSSLQPLGTGENKSVTAEPLSLGDWVGISGAAFSTALGNVGSGSGTNLGMSLLCGLFNVRLGYWWSNSFSPGGAINKSFPVQRYLADEFAGSFHVLERDHWYLTDGGHFENTAAYELIRRRVPFILLVDCGADPDGTFDDLANLTRRVRVDFRAELTPASPARVQEILAGDGQKIGSIEDLRLEKSYIGRPENASIHAGEDDLLLACRVKKYAAFAEVTYPDTAEKTLMLILKPGLIGDEPADLINYQRMNPTFPQQTTSDQFYDEAQWESYRKLGEFAMNSLLADGWLAEFLEPEENFPLIQKPGK